MLQSRTALDVSCTSTQAFAPSVFLSFCCVVCSRLFSAPPSTQRLLLTLRETSPCGCLRYDFRGQTKLVSRVWSWSAELRLCLVMVSRVEAEVVLVSPCVALLNHTLFSASPSLYIILDCFSPRLLTHSFPSRSALPVGLNRAELP